MTKEEALQLEPFDVVVYTDSNGKSIDVLVKRVTEIGVFILPRIQSTANLVNFKDINKQF